MNSIRHIFISVIKGIAKFRDSACRVQNYVDLNNIRELIDRLRVREADNDSYETVSRARALNFAIKSHDRAIISRMAGRARLSIYPAFSSSAISTLSYLRCSRCHEQWARSHSEIEAGLITESIRPSVVSSRRRFPICYLLVCPSHYPAAGNAAFSRRDFLLRNLITVAALSRSQSTDIIPDQRSRRVSYEKPIYTRDVHEKSRIPLSHFLLQVF